MVPEDLLFWISPISTSDGEHQNVLCRRHADAMSVPRGWTLDDRREDAPRLFMAARFDDADSAATSKPRRRRRSNSEAAEQLVIDGTGETARPDPEALPAESDADTAPGSWAPSFDERSDLDGLLEVSSPLLARAFRGTDRRRS